MRASTDPGDELETSVWIRAVPAADTEPDIPLFARRPPAADAPRARRPRASSPPPPLPRASSPPPPPRRARSSAALPAAPPAPPPGDAPLRRPAATPAASFAAAPPPPRAPSPAPWRPSLAAAPPPRASSPAPWLSSLAGALPAERRLPSVYPIPVDEGEIWRPRPATAVEPAPLRRPRRSRLVAAAAVAGAAAAVIIAAAVQIVAARQPTPLAIAPPGLEASRARPSDLEAISRVGIAAPESSRIHHRLSAPYRDIWRDSVWYHPLTGEKLLPENRTRKFGARRHGDRPIECGRGHCGVDLGHFGLAVRAAQDGVIERVERISRGAAGRYVRIAHDDGFVSDYMHLHRIEPDLRPGMRVRGGEKLGIVGRTGIRRSRPHLHFALAYRDGREKIFVDPEPLLRHSIPAVR